MSKRRARPRERTRDVRPTALVRGDERLGPPVTIQVTLRMREWEAFLARLPDDIRDGVMASFREAADKMDTEVAALEARIGSLHEQLATNQVGLADLDRQLAEVNGG